MAVSETVLVEAITSSNIQGASDMKNLEISGNFNGRRKVRDFLKTRKLRETSINFVMQNSFQANISILILKILWGACPHNPLNSLRLMLEFNLSLKKSGNFIPSIDWTP